MTVARLFAAGLRRGTLLLWLAFFMSLLVICLLSKWLPTPLRSTGAALVTAMFQVGSTLGAIVPGWLIDHIDPHLGLALSYAAAGVCIAAIGSFAATPWVAAVAVWWAAFCVSGAQVGANALPAAFCPTDCRASGASELDQPHRPDRLGGGSLAGGAMPGAGLPMPALLVASGVPAVVAGVAVLALGRHRTRVPDGGEAMR